MYFLAEKLKLECTYNLANIGLAKQWFFEPEVMISTY
jgi:hypothetical protein